MVHALFAFKLV